MSILQAMFSGSSALINFGEAMTVIGNNLANANTTSFKASTTSFQDVLMQTVGRQGSGIETQVGTGVGLSAVSQDMAQGSFTPSAFVTDLSIDGKGFFKVKDITTDGINETGNRKDIFYTRAGGFKKNNDGDLVNAGGLVLRGMELAYDPVTDETIEVGNEKNINFDKFELASPTPTTQINMSVNLKSDDPVITIPYDPDNAATYNHSSPARIFDAQGNSHLIDVQFRKLAQESPATAVGGDGNDTISFTLSSIANVELTFTPLNGTAANQPIVKTYDNINGKFDANISNLLEDGIRYAISYKVTENVAGVPTENNTLLSSMIGDDNVEEVIGEKTDGIWEWHAVVPSSELTDSTADTSSTLTDLTKFAMTKAGGATGSAGYTSGRLEFDSAGRLVNEGSTPLRVNFLGVEDASGTAIPQDILFNFGDAVGAYGDSTADYQLVHSTDANFPSMQYEALDPNDASATNTGALGSRSLALESSLRNFSQNGFSTGYLDQLSVSNEGIVSASYTNGETKELYQIVLADFKDEAALEQVGSNLYQETLASGPELINNPTVGRLGGIVSFSLENSNVDMSTEFVRMISIQRGFQANSRIITVTDGMLEELIALKR
ncbi:MAG: flagellar hook-basal body complex protein [Magnetococcales bacterium]|nr:flagellar hook-basal body complex protein [Magnetococcales bacterium]